MLQLGARTLRHLLIGFGQRLPYTLVAHLLEGLLGQDHPAGGRAEAADLWDGQVEHRPPHHLGGLAALRRLLAAAAAVDRRAPETARTFGARRLRTGLAGSGRTQHTGHC